MIRSYDEFLARVFDHVSASLVALVLLVVAVAAGVLWYTYPAWLRVRVPWPGFRLRWPRWRWLRWRWPRWRRPRFRKRARKERAGKKKRVPESSTRTPEAEPDRRPQPHPSFLSLADRLAAEGRYAEAIRERLRESVTALSRYGVIAPAPAWTAQEVAAQASANRPAVSGPLTGATGIFSEVWYGRRPAGPDQDAVMRRLTAEITAALENPR